jgi:hypothetical protein
MENGDRRKDIPFDVNFVDGDIGKARDDPFPRAFYFAASGASSKHKRR